MPHPLDYRSPTPPRRKKPSEADFWHYAAGAVLALLAWAILLAWAMGLFWLDLD